MWRIFAVHYCLTYVNQRWARTICRYRVTTSHYVILCLPATAVGYKKGLFVVYHFDERATLVDGVSSRCRLNKYSAGFCKIQYIHTYMHTYVHTEKYAVPGHANSRAGSPLAHGRGDCNMAVDMHYCARTRTATLT